MRAIYACIRLLEKPSDLKRARFTALMKLREPFASRRKALVETLEGQLLIQPPFCYSCAEIIKIYKIKGISKCQNGEVCGKVAAIAIFTKFTF